MASKSNLFPGILAALMGGIGAFLLSQFQFSVWIEPSGSDNSPPVLEVSPSISPSVFPNQHQQGKPQAIKPPASTDGLRVSNQTTYPIRLVLLARNFNPQQNRATNPQTSYREPVHWDFAPDEGSNEGLILSLPEGNLKLHSGDVLMAFALDGSRHYWGPYVVGQTTSPSRKNQPSEWQLILRP
jgi:hypothetical protein